MDPMDFTMEDSLSPQMQQPPNHPPPQCQRILSSTLNGAHRDTHYSTMPQDTHAYDPIHNTESWFTRPPPFTPPLQAASSLNDHPPVFNGWSSYGGDLNTGSYHASYGHWNHRPGQRGYMGSESGISTQFGGYGSMRRDRHSLPGAPESNSAGYAPSTTPINPMSHASSPTAATNLGRPYFNNGHDLPNNPYIENSGRFGRLTATRATRGEARASQNGFSASASRSVSYNSHSTSLAQARAFPPGWDSDDEDEEIEGMRIAYHRYYDEDGLLTQNALSAVHAVHAMHAQQLLKTVPSKAALASLEKIDLHELEDKCCSICYDEIGVTNPDGILEHPVRLPKCKHVFGDKCLDTWFKDKDTCPYCRDKLPSEPKSKVIPVEQLRLLGLQNRQQRELLARRHAQDHPPESYIRTSSRWGPPEDRSYRNYNDPTDPFAYSPPNNARSNRESPDHRRRTNRGRANLNRPSPGVFRNLSNSHNAAQRIAASVTASQCPARQRTPSVNSSPEASPSPSGLGRGEQASPAVVVGSGITTQRPASFGSYGEFVPHGSFSVAYGQGVATNAFLQDRGSGSFIQGENSSHSIGDVTRFPVAASVDSHASSVGSGRAHFGGW